MTPCSFCGTPFDPTDMEPPVTQCQDCLDESVADRDAKPPDRCVQPIGICLGPLGAQFLDACLEMVEETELSIVEAVCCEICGNVLGEGRICLVSDCPESPRFGEWADEQNSEAF